MFQLHSFLILPVTIVIFSSGRKRWFCHMFNLQTDTSSLRMGNAQQWSCERVVLNRFNCREWVTQCWGWLIILLHFQHSFCWYWCFSTGSLAVRSLAWGRLVWRIDTASPIGADLTCTLHPNRVALARTQTNNCSTNTVDRSSIYLRAILLAFLLHFTSSYHLNLTDKQTHQVHCHFSSPLSSIFFLRFRPRV